MYDNATRSIWLEEQIWPALQAAFPSSLAGLPREALITVGYPSAGARGRSEKIRPCEITKQWQGNTNEQIFVSVHPVFFDTAENVVKALLYGAATFQLGVRWGGRDVGILKKKDGSLEVVKDSTAQTIAKILQEIGKPPAGFGILHPVRQVQRVRNLLYVPDEPLCTHLDAKGEPEKHPKIRAASSTLNVACQHCQAGYTLEV